MPDYVVQLIVGLSGCLLGFIGGFFTKSFMIKIKQKIKGNNNVQQINNISNGK